MDGSRLTRRETSDPEPPGRARQASRCSSAGKQKRALQFSHGAETAGHSHPSDWQFYSSSRRVGAHLAVGAPPGTVRAPLDAYGSTSDNAERADFQRGQPRVAPESEFGVTCDTDDLRSFLELR